MILAAGLGTRLGSLGAAQPKVLIDVGGRPLLEHHLDYLEASGATRVVINAHHRAELISAAAERYRGPLEVIVVREPELLGTAGGVRNALPHLGLDPFLVLYGDVLVREPVAAMFDTHRRARAVATLAVHAAQEAEGKGTVEVDDSGFVRHFAEKQASAEGPALINSGIYVLERQVVERLAAGAFCDFGNDVFPSLIAEGAPVATLRLRAPVIDIGTPEGLSLARDTLTAGDLK